MSFSHNRLIRPLLAALATFIAVGALAACSKDDGATPSSATAAEDALDGTGPTDGRDSSSTTSVLSSGTSPSDDEIVPVPSTLAPERSLALAVYWMRPFGEPRPIDIPAHQDGAGGPFPFVLYGAVTNNTTDAVGGPGLEVVWRDGAGVAHLTTPGRLVAPDGADLGELAPGAMTDFIVVVEDESTAARLTDLQPALAEE
jgi:hypothetical protein